MRIAALPARSRFPSGSQQTLTVMWLRSMGRVRSSGLPAPVGVRPRFQAATAAGGPWPVAACCESGPPLGVGLISSFRLLHLLHQAALLMRMSSTRQPSSRFSGVVHSLGETFSLFITLADTVLRPNFFLTTESNTMPRSSWTTVPFSSSCSARPMTIPSLPFSLMVLILSITQVNAITAIDRGPLLQKCRRNSQAW